MDVNARDDHKRTPLHYIGQDGYSIRSAPDIVKLLVAAGADVNARDDKNNTPLHLTAKNSEF